MRSFPTPGSTSLTALSRSKGHSLLPTPLHTRWFALLTPDSWLLTPVFRLLSSNFSLLTPRFALPARSLPAAALIVFSLLPIPYSLLPVLSAQGITPQGVITTVAGDGGLFRGNGGLAASAALVSAGRAIPAGVL